jgi:hypothetical protein
MVSLNVNEESVQLRQSGMFLNVGGNYGRLTIDFYPTIFPTFLCKWQNDEKRPVVIQFKDIEIANEFFAENKNYTIITRL